MKVWSEITSTGIGLRIGDAALPRLEQSPNVNQVNPGRSYVYAHCDEKGAPFYIGKGVARRAWNDSRHPLWHRYVERHLAGIYSVRILIDDLSPEQAEEIESKWIAQESEALVNWINFGRKTDFKALEKYHALRNENRELIAATRQLEKSDAELAINAYAQAIVNIASYAMLKTEDGLIGRLLDEERKELGYSGELEALDRLPICLLRLGRGSEAQAVMAQYFADYKADQRLRLAESIKKRVAKATRNSC